MDRGDEYNLTKNLDLRFVPFIYVYTHIYMHLWGFPGDSVGKESACNAGDHGLIPGSRRSPGEGNDNPLQ